MMTVSQTLVPILIVVPVAINKMPYHDYDHYSAIRLTSSPRTYKIHVPLVNKDDVVSMYVM